MTATARKLEPAVPTPSFDLQRIPIAQIVESPLNPRRQFDDKTLQELADNIAQVGIITPLLVRPHAKGYEIAAGHRRFRAAKLAKLAEVPCIVRELDDRAFLEVMTIENLQREDIHPLDEALGYQALIDKTGMDVAAIAARVGKSESYVYQRMKLAALVPALQKAFLDEELTAGHAILIARLQPKDQTQALKAMKWHDPMSVRELAGWIENNLHLDLGEAAFDPAADTLVPAAGPCTTCPKRTGNQPSLFPDIKKGDTCTDPACFKAKVKAHGDRAVKEAKAAGTPVVKISLRYGGAKGVLGENDYKVIRKRCDHAKLGRVVDAWDRQRAQLGEVKLICDNKKCKEHWPPATVERRAPSAQEKKAQAELKAAKAKEAIEAAARAKAIGSLLAAIAKKPVLDVDALRAATRAVLDGCYEDNDLKPLCDHHGLKPSGNWQGHSTAIEKAIKTADLPRLTELLLGILLCAVVSDAEFAGVARRHRVDLAKLRKEAAAELAPKAPATKVQTSAKPKKATAKKKAKA